MERTNVINEGLEAVAEGVLPLEMDEGFLYGHGLGLYITVGADIIEDGMQVLFLHRREDGHIDTGSLEEVDELIACDLSIHTDAGTDEGGDVTAIEFVFLLLEVGILIFLPCAELLPEDLLQFANIGFGERVKVVYLLEDIVVLAILGKVIEYALLVGDLDIERCCHAIIGDDIGDVNIEGLAFHTDEELHE